MLNISLNNNKEYIIIANIDNISEDNEKELKIFLHSNSEIFKEVRSNKQENEIFLFFNKSLNSSLNQLEKYLQKHNISYDLDKTIKEFKNKQKQHEKKIIDLRKIGQDLKMSKIPKEFELEYEEFKDFCGTNFTQKHCPLPNQIKSAFFHLKIEKSCNFSAPGTGKTTIVYSLFHWLKNKKHEEIDAIFVLGPKSSLSSWKNEYTECFGRKPLSIDFNMKNFKRELSTTVPYNYKDIIYFLNYEKVKSCKKDLNKFFRKYRILLILDEAHRIKNPDSQISNCLSEILNNTEIDIPYQIILTGTPIPNGYENLYSYFDLTKRIDNSILSKSYEELKKIKNDDENEIAEVFEQVSPFFYSLRKKDMENFKEPECKEISCEMENFQEKFFIRLKKRLFDRWSNDIDQKINLTFYRSKMIRLMQIQTDIRMLLKPVNEIIFHSTKLETDDFLEERLNNELKVLEKITFDADMNDLKIEVSEIRSEIEKYDKEDKIPDKYIKLLNKVKELLKNDKKVIIWSSWVYCINKINNLLNQEKIKCGLLYGAIPYEKREEIIETFKDEKNRELMVLVANPASVGESISLHKACQNAIYFDINFNVTSHFQSKDRIHRYGMPKEKEQVTYYYLLSKNSIEKSILNHIQTKEQQMNDFLDKNQNLFSFKDSDFNNFMPEIDDIKEIFSKDKD